ncbi:unnamed protein product [Pelagomonas calceolata]|uniref:Uncharacterized protein n=1 Tax=Pelagomonas calceolata TaxID=35677 RepID=A0A8J2X0U4_9STRA|nr:unnamed protein product [Pelagomonas calceolata]
MAQDLAALESYGARTDWASLAATDPKLAACTATFKGETGVDWTRPEARAVVAEALLRHDFGITYQAAPGHLVPCVPNRVRYVAWAAKVAGDGVTNALDVGCGASCIIALLAARCRGWRVVASESDDKACAEAAALVAKNSDWNAGALVDVFRVCATAASQRPVSAALDAAGRAGVDVVLANPPWFESDDERRNACGGAPRRDGAAEATAAETVRDDGEVGFCAALIEDALRLQSRVAWHSALLGRKQSLRRVLALLRERGISRVATTTIDLGRTTRWAVAFSVAAGPAPRGDARVFAKKRDPARDVAVPADCSVPELRDRLAARAVALHADATVSDVDADGALWRVRVVSRGARLDAVVSATGARGAYRLRAVPQGAADALARFCDGLPGDLARTNRRWRRKLAK